MDKRVLLGAGAAALAVAAFFALRGAGTKVANTVVTSTFDQLAAQLSPGSTLTHGATEVNPLTQAVTVHNVAITLPDQRMITAETVTLTGVDLLACRDVFDVGAYPGGKPAWTERRVLVAGAAIDTLKATRGQDTVTLAHAALRNLSAHPFSAPPTAETRHRPGFAAEAAADFKLDGANASGFAAMAGGKQAFTSGVGSLTIDNYDAGKLASLVLRDVTIDTRAPAAKQPVLAKLGSAELRGLDASGVVKAAATSGGHVDNVALGSLTYARFALAGLDVRMTGGPSVSLADLQADQQVPGADGARAGKLAMTALRLDWAEAPVSAAAQAALDAFGARAITMDVAGAGHGVPGGVSEVSEDFVFHDLGTLRLKASFSGFVQPSGQDPQAALRALGDVSLQRARIEFDDASLTGRIFKVAAVQSHTTPEALRAQLALPLLALGVMVPDQPDAADQVTSFLNAPHTLSVTMTPAAKVTFAEVGRAPANERAHLLGLRISAAEGK